jgi:kynurenine 3-monooxygenase
MDRPRFVVVGGGLAGALAACYLGKAGYEVDVFEMRDDLRVSEIGGGRSINLALSYRGLCALEPVGLAAEVLKTAVPMRGRMIHSVTGELTFQHYGVEESQAINSVSRGGLNAILLSAAERYPSVRLHFDEKCTDVDLDTGEAEFTNTRTGQHRRLRGDVVLSADGAFSAVRRSMQKRERFNYSQEYLEHGYKELTIPPGPGGRFQLERNALHIWPRRSFMMIALPNADGSFTCTLFWPFEGPDSFAAITSEQELMAFFNEQFPDAVPLMPALAQDYFGNPTGSLVTVRCSPWHVGGRVLLLGDAAHAVVPFYGQGMNAAFEDVLVLDECVRRFFPSGDRKGVDEAPAPDFAGGLERAFEAFEAVRKPNANALAELAIGNFIEMRDYTGSKLFLMKKKGEKLLAKLLPGWYLPLYTMVTFTRIPYAEAVARSRRQNWIVAAAVSSTALAAAIAAAWIW